jgi:hypothetical protein
MMRLGVPVKIVDASVFVGVYGSLQVHPWLRGAVLDQDAYSLFASRATSMGWSYGSGEGALWGMNDAGQDWEPGEGPARVAWFQVGTTDPTRRVVPVAPILACVRDTVARIGELDLAAVQMVLPVQTAGPATEQLLSGLNWFATADPAARTAVRVTLDSGDAAAHRAAFDVLAAVRQDWTGPFRVDEVSEAAPVDPQPPVVDDLWMGTTRNPVTFDCSVPEWTLDATGWLVALFVEGCRQAGIRTTVLMSVAPRLAG